MEKSPLQGPTEKTLCVNHTNKLPALIQMRTKPFEGQIEISAFTGIPVKLRSRTGESIAETLVALLIGSVALVMLAGMITTSAHLITKSKTLMEEYYEDNKSLETKPTAASGTLKITIKSTGTIILDKTYSADYYENNRISGKPVISYLFKPNP